MKDFYDNMNRILQREGFYEILFENPNENNEYPDFVRISNLFFGFCYLKILDLTLKPTKEEVLAKSKENIDLYQVAKYENGESIGFYNISEYDIEKIKNSDNPCNALIDYIDGFSDNVKELYTHIEFKKHLKFLKKYNILNDYLERLYFDSNISEITDYDELVSIMKFFVNYMASDEYYSMGLEDILNDDPYSSYPYIQNSIDEYGEFLNKLLLYETHFENKCTFKIYDPNSNGTYILEKAKNGLLKKYPESKIELYGKCKREENETIVLAKNIITKNDSYATSGAEIIDPNESIFQIDNINNYDDFDLIVTNYIGSLGKEYRYIMKYFQNKRLKQTKVVMAIDSIEKVEKFLDKIIANDNLESIIHFKTHYILILNTGKSDDKKGKFLLIDEGEIDDGDENKILEKRELFKNSHYYLFQKICSAEFSEMDLKKMENICELYKEFETTDDSILIENKDYDGETIEVLIY